MMPAIQKNISSFLIPDNQMEAAFEANQYALNHYALAIAGSLCGIDGDLNINEQKMFLKLFPYFGAEHLSMLQDVANDNGSVYINCKRFNKFANNNKTVSARLYARLFKLACSDDTLNIMEISFLEKVADMLGLSNVFLEKALEFYFLNDAKEVKKFDAYMDARNYYRKEMMRFHPDMYMGDDILSKRIKNKILSLANERMKILNENYSRALI